MEQFMVELEVISVGHGTTRVEVRHYVVLDYLAYLVEVG
jgi:hypothetical protein